MGGKETDPAYEEVFSPEQMTRIRSEYDRLKGLCYLDQAGSALYSKSHLEGAFADLQSNVYSNPHSNNTTSKLCSDSIDQVRYRILHHFNTDVEKYSVIFTGSATESIKLLAQSFEWRNDTVQGSHGQCGQFVYTEDNHTSILGMRSLVSQRGASVRCLDHEEALSIFSSSENGFNPESPANGLSSERPTNSLFVYSGQCNFSGVKYPLSWIADVHNGVLNDRSNWYVLLDATSLISTDVLNLSKVSPDFVCVSFYKIFGYPTGLGALLVKNSSHHVLKRNYYGGGTVLVALSAVNEYVPRPAIHESFEDGTLNFISIIGLLHAFDAMKETIIEYTLLSRHCFHLARYLFQSLARLHHSNGSPAVVLYADTAYDDAASQGGIVNFNMLRANGEHIGFAEVLHMANVHDIQLRTGCFCNPGACRRHLGLSTEDVRRHFQAGHVCGDENDIIDGRPTGSVRVSFGVFNTKHDVDHLLGVLGKCFVHQPAVHKWPSNWQKRLENLRSKFNKKPTKSQRENADSQNCNDKDQTQDSGRIRNHNLHAISRVEYPIFSEPTPPAVIWKGVDKSNSNLVFTNGRYDRQWMITNQSGVALTQKSEPLLCLLQPFIDEANNRLRLSFEGQPDITVPLNLDVERGDGNYSFCQSKVCGDRIRGNDCGDDVGIWLSNALHKPGLRLIRQLPDDNRTNKKSLG
ncbi:unnamed protein product [Nesidiocoris tenuis]|uniref:Molybdenum cofactor sulfurtransferase n=1 Tax=Nesidiocoris tenuis TaxID=355587 RepID=A0A6H5GZV5_9HEMI|nr:unnamed protein product [Nesidiocoris tenuis]